MLTLHIKYWSICGNFTWHHSLKGCPRDRFAPEPCTVYSQRPLSTSSSKHSPLRLGAGIRPGEEKNTFWGRACFKILPQVFLQNVSKILIFHWNFNRLAQSQQIFKKKIVLILVQKPNFLARAYYDWESITCFLIFNKFKKNRIKI